MTDQHACVPFKQCLCYSAMEDSTNAGAERPPLSTSPLRPAFSIAEASAPDGVDEGVLVLQIGLVPLPAKNARALEADATSYPANKAQCLVRMAACFSIVVLPKSSNARWPSTLNIRDTIAIVLAIRVAHESATVRKGV